MLHTLFGDGPDLTPLQMSLRAAAVFLLTLLLLRIAGRRALGQHSSFDVCIAVLLGAVLSRAVVGASPFLATIVAAAVLVVLHRLIAWWGVRSPRFERLVTGRERVLVDRGVPDDDAMQAALISESDLREAMRKQFGDDALDRLERAVLERSGEVSLSRKVRSG
ncbi:MAG TPA: YetF domain-containing protein [Burkholderiaceae bacterium]|nr:YetF domain-containing protein [Burkholderiaceae bacterium]